MPNEIQVFVLSPKFANHVHTYGEDFTDALPVLATELIEGEVEQDSAESALAHVKGMELDSVELLDSVLMSVCGWTFDTLSSMAETASVTLGEMLAREVNSDDDDPFKNTGNIILAWGDASVESREQVDAFFVALCGKSITETLNFIQSEVLAKMN